MKQATHLLDPVKASTGGVQTMRCGRTQNFNTVEPIFTTNPAEVTCTKCLSYINNPWRVLRKYGYVKVVEDMFVMFWGQYGYKFDMCAIIDYPGTWNIVVSHNGQWNVNLTTQAGNTTKLGFKLVDIIENEIIKLKLNSTTGKKSPFDSPFVKWDEEPATSNQHPETSNQQPE
jgi:hypothetical protein